MATWNSTVVEQVKEHWPEHREKLAANPSLAMSVDESIMAHSRSLL
ncbi:MAG: hypothetical protein ACRDTC_15795 [Pseudonocardiaceae bacterium]